MKRLSVLSLLVAMCACVSPEAKRTRGGGAGADIGNRSDSLQMHGGSLMYSRTPCLLPKAECPGPLAQSGLPGDFPVAHRQK